MTGVGVRRLRLVFGLAVAVGFVWLLARELEGEALERAFAGLSVASVLLALGFIAVAHGLRIVRWWWMLRALEPGLPLVACARPFLASMAVNNVLPLRAGDALRVVGFRRQLRSPAMRVLGTLAIERALDVVFLAAIFFACLLALPRGALPQGFVVAAVWLAALAVAALLAAMLFPPLAGRLFQRLCRHLEGYPVLARRGWPQALGRQGDHLLAALAVMRSPSATLALTGLSGAVWACEGMAFVVLAAVLQPGVAALAPWLALAAGTLATAVPGAPGHIGTFDWFAAQGFAVWGASPEAAAALALTVHALWLPPTVVGLACYWLPFGGGGPESAKMGRRRGGASSGEGDGGGRGGLRRRGGFC